MGTGRSARESDINGAGDDDGDGTGTGTSAFALRNDGGGGGAHFAMRRKTEGDQYLSSELFN